MRVEPFFFLHAEMVPLRKKYKFETETKLVLTLPTLLLFIFLFLCVVSQRERFFFLPRRRNWCEQKNLFTNTVDG